MGNDEIRICICMYVRIYVYVYKYIYIHTYIHTCIHTYIYTHPISSFPISRIARYIYLYNMYIQVGQYDELACVDRGGDEGGREPTHHLLSKACKDTY